MKSLLFIFGLTFIVSSTYGFVFEAEFTDLGDSPITYSAAVVNLKVYNPAKNCLLFEESHTVDLSLTNGKVSLELGTGSLVSLNASYSNSNEVLLNNIGAASCPYNPGPADGRILEVTFDDGTNGAEVMGDINISPTPQATYASESGMANSLSMKNATFSTTFATQANTNYTLIFPINAGASGEVLTTDGAGVLSWVNILSPTTICSASEVLLGDGSCAVLPAVGPGTVTSTDISDGTITNADINASANIDQSKITNLTTDLASKQAMITTGSAAQYLRGDLSLATLEDDVRSTLLTGFSSGAGTVMPTDSILQAIQKLDGNITAVTPSSNTDGLPEGGANLYFTEARAKAAAVINTTAGVETDQAASVAAMKSYVTANAIPDNSITALKLSSMGASIGQVLVWSGSSWQASDSSGGLTYAGSWDSNSNIPDLTAGGNAGEYYIVNNTGAFDLSGGPGTNSWSVGDWAIWNDTSNRWDKINNAANVTTFNGRNGMVVPTAGDYTWTQIDKTSSLLSDIQNVDAPAGNGSDTGKVLKWNNSISRWELADDLTGGGPSILQGGNNLGSAVDIGTNDSFPLKFKTNSSEVMRIDESGNIGVGTITPAEKLHVLGNLRVQGATDCTLGAGAGATNCTSDERLKDNVSPIANALDKIKLVKGVEFTWNELAVSPGRSDIGVIAQDIQRVFPTAVVENNEGYLGVDYAVLVAPLIESVKELDHNQEMLKRMHEGIIKDHARELASLKKINEAIIKENQEIKGALCTLSPTLSLCHKK